MISLDPKWKFAIGIFITAAIGISSGSLALKGAIPADWIGPVTAWSGIIAFLGSAAQTGLQGFGMSNSARIAAAQTIPVDDKIALAANTDEVSKIVTTKAIAQAAGPEGVGAKIVSK